MTAGDDVARFGIPVTYHDSTLRHNLKNFDGGTGKLLVDSALLLRGRAQVSTPACDRRGRSIRLDAGVGDLFYRDFVDLLRTALAADVADRRGDDRKWLVQLVRAMGGVKTTDAVRRGFVDEFRKPFLGQKIEMDMEFVKEITLSP